MGFLRLGGACTSKLWPSMAFALFMVLALGGFAQPVHAYPAECTGNASDGTPRCVEPLITAASYGICVQTGFLWPDIKLNNCAGSATGGVGVVDDATANAVLSCLLEESASFDWQPEGAQIFDPVLCGNNTVKYYKGVEVHGWAAHGGSSKFGWGTVARRDRGAYCPDGYQGSGSDPNYPDFCIKEPCIECTMAKIALSGGTITKALIAGPVLSELATVTKNGAPVPGANVTISIDGGGSISGATDAGGQFAFTYVPPYVATTANLTGTCTTCGNTATLSIQVLACDACTGPGGKGSLFGNPVSPSTGEKYQTESDWTDQSPHDLSLTRNYRSLGLSSSSGLGGYWTHNYAGRWIQKDLQATIWLGDGTRVVFKRVDANSPWVADNGRDSLSYVLSSGNITGAIFTRASDETRWRFDANGNPVTVAQRNGWAHTLAYNAAGQLQSVTNAFGRTLQFSYTNAGLLSSVTLPTGQSIAYGFDSSSRLVAVTYPDNTSRSYAYGTTAFPQALTSITNEAGAVYATFTYDSAGRAIGTQHIGGVQNFTFNYPALDASGTGGRLTTAAIDPAIYVQTAQISDPSGNSQTYTWQGGDGQIHFLGSTGMLADESVASRVLNTAGLPTSETDFLGNVTTYQWDTIRRLQLSRTESSGKPEARTSTTQWLANWRLPVVETAPKRITTYVYNGQADPFNGGAVAACAPASVVFDDGSAVPLLCKKVEQASTDANGSAGVSATVDSNVPARTWQWTYNAKSQVLTQTDPRGGTTSNTYDVNGNLASSSNALGQVTQYTQYDGAGRLLQSADPNGVVSTYGYDSRGRMTSSNVGGQATASVYGPTGLLTQTTQPDGTIQTFGYDSADRLISVSDNQGNSIQYTLDGAGNRVSEQVKDPSGALSRQLARAFNTLGKKQQVTGME